MEYQHITIEYREHLAVLTISRPEVLNALNASVLAEITQALNELELSDEVRVVTLTGAGEKAFVAGADVAEMRDLDPLRAQDLAEMGGHVAQLIEQSGKPFIAAINGFALGGGCELALACDFIYAARSARFGQPEVKLGVIPGFGGTQRLMRRVGIAKAKELVFTGSMIGADEALRIGLCDKVVEPEELMSAVAETAAAIAQNGPLAVAEAKQVMHLGQSMSLDAALALEQRSFGSLFATDDQSEGMSAFLDKRKAAFSGR